MSDDIKSLEASLANDEDNWETRTALIEAWLEKEDHAKAVEVLSGATSLPGDDAGLVQAARGYALVGATDQAADICRSALEANPENADAKAYLAALAAHAEGGEEAEAADDSPEESADGESDEDAAEKTAAPAAVREETPTATASQPVTPVRMSNPASEPEDDGPPAPDAASAEPQMAPAPNVVQEVDIAAFDAEAAAELERIHEAEEESRRIHEKRIKRDKFNAVAVAVLINVGIIVALTLVATKIPPNVPPQIVASSQQEVAEDVIENTTMNRPTQAASASSAALTDIVTANAVSSIAVSETQVDTATTSLGVASTGMDFTPSMSLGAPSSSESKMMFGQKIEGDVLGVILDVSGSMAEFLPHVVREVDKNFPDAPIAYVRNVVVRKRTKEPDVRLIIPDEVRAHDEDGNRTQYWFLWHDLPRKAPQRYVDRLIETFKTRPNQFLAVRHRGGNAGDFLPSAIDFLVEQDIDSLYIFSDFEDFVDEALAEEIGQNLGRRKIRTYVQPAEKSTPDLKTMTNKVANRTRGRQMPTLVSIFQGDDDVPQPLTVAEKEDLEANSPFNYATPRDEMIGKEWYHYRPAKGQSEITRVERDEFTAVFYGPQAEAVFFLKDDEGKYIQNPIRFYYHSWKWDPEKQKDPAYRGRRRKYLRNSEDPTFDKEEGEIVWKMVLEDELKFNVHFYIGGLGTEKFNATYTAEPPKDGSTDHAHISFRIPRLAHEKSDVYFGQDLPPEGLKILDEIRAGAKLNTVTFNLPRQDRDRYANSWKLDGFEPGRNPRTFDQLIRRMPNGIRDMVVEGPSFGPRKIEARTTSSKILLSGWAGRADIEPWESFAAALVRSGDTRERFTKTEAIALQIE